MYLRPLAFPGTSSSDSEKKDFSRSKVHSWTKEPARLNNSFSRVARHSLSSAPTSWPLYQDTLRKWERSPREQTFMCNLTFKTVFLALGSGKHRSEIHVWQNKNIRHQSDWSKVSIYPSPSCLSKNQLAKEGLDSVTPVVIPALAPTLDKSFESDRSLCPVRALHYCLDRTSDLKQNKELVFDSFKKDFNKDI